MKELKEGPESEELAETPEGLSGAPTEAKCPKAVKESEESKDSVETKVDDLNGAQASKAEQQASYDGEFSAAR